MKVQYFVAAIAARLAVQPFGPELQTVSQQGMLTVATSQNPQKIAQDYLKSQINIQPGYDFVVKNSYQTKDNGVTHVYYRQTFEGVEITNADAAVNVDRYGRVLNFHSSFYQGSEQPTSHDQVVFQEEVSVAQAVKALADFVGVQCDANQFTSALVNDDQSAFPGATAEEAVYLIQNVDFAAEKQVPAVRRYIINSQNTVVPVYDLAVDMKDGDDYFSAQVDMQGQVVQLVNWVAQHNFNVFPLGVNDPHDGDREMVVNPENKEASPLGWNDQGKSSQFKTTIGNNVFAQNNPSGRSSYENNYRPTAADQEEQLVFNYPADLKKQPTEYVDASITNLFYWNNIIHDILYVYGFDEKAGNFQQNNFGKGGRENDAVVAFAQDGQGTNNANFLTPPDGQKGRMRMYVWTQTNPRRDGDFEAGIIIHEYCHGLSNRLIGGPANANCMGFGQSGGMGEGYGDFISVVFRMREEYTDKKDFPMGEYSANRGIRPFPYSTDMKTNPQTYGYLTKGPYRAVHTAGSLFAEILFEVYWSLVNELGFSKDIYDVKSGKGNTIILKNVLDGMKLQPCRPNFIQARDSFLLADEQNFDGANKCLMWKGFAKRGMGPKAGKDGRVEDFEVPQECK